MKVAQSCPTFCDCGLYSPRNSPDQNTGVGSLSLLQGIFPTQGSNPGLPHCRQILYQLSHKGSPRILEWVAYPFSSGSSWPRNWTRVSCTAGGFFTSWATRKTLGRNCIVIQEVCHPVGEGNGNPLQCSCLKNPMDRGAWWAIYSPWARKELDTTEWLSLIIQ